MSERASLAERAVDALAAVHRMDIEVTNEDALRHTVRSLKRHAEAILMDAFQRARDLACTAEDLLRESRTLTKKSEDGNDSR